MDANWSRLGVVLALSWDPLGAFLGPLGALWEPLEAVLGPLQRLLGHSWGHPGRLQMQIGETLKNATPPTRNAHFPGQDGYMSSPS